MPSACSAIASRPTDTCSPVEAIMSSSRCSSGGGRWDLLLRAAGGAADAGLNPLAAAARLQLERRQPGERPAALLHARDLQPPAPAGKRMRAGAADAERRLALRSGVVGHRCRL